MKLYYAPGACSLADHIALAEAGLAYDLAKVDLKAKTIEGGGDYLAVNPKGYVPALDIGSGDIVTENIAILTYIADRSGGMIADGAMGRYRTLELLAYISTEIHKNFKPFFNPAASEAEKEEAAATLRKRFDLLARPLESRRFLLSDDLTVADCYAYVMLRWAAKNALEIPEKLKAYRETMRARPGVARALSEEGLD